MTRLRLGLLVVPAFLAACASTGDAPSDNERLTTPDGFTVSIRSGAPPHRTVVAAPIGRVWELLPSVYEDLGYPAAPASNASVPTFITPHMRITGQLYPGERNSDYVDCSRAVSGERADSYEVRFAILTRLRGGDPGETIVETILDGRARDRAVTGAAVSCQGTGKLEGAIADLLRRKVASSGG